MKKLVFLLALVVAINSAHAQYSTAKVFSLQAHDTLNNVDSSYRSFQNTTGIASMGIQVNVKTLSGTLAGKVILYASNNNRDYVAIDSSNYTATAPIGKVFGAASPYTNVAIINRPTAPFQYYIIMATSTGTVSAATQFLLTTRKSYN